MNPTVPDAPPEDPPPRTPPPNKLTSPSRSPCPAPSSIDPNYHLQNSQLQLYPASANTPSPPRRARTQSQWTIPPGLNTAEHRPALIRQISTDDSLSDGEKDRRRQIVHTSRFEAKNLEDERVFSEEMDRSAAQPSYSDVHDAEGNRLLGCRHYPRNCKLFAECCHTWVVCRRCHDDAHLNHTFDRFATKRVRCMLCQLVQPVAKVCAGCNVPFASYFCGKCKFYDNTPGKDIYHCDKCKICRVGKGIGIGNFHCTRCDACVSNKYASTHRCLNKSLDANCPICGDYLFTSTQPIVFMRCGHTMHSHCFDTYTQDYYTCPLCQKTLTDMQSYYDQIDEKVKAELMPKKYRNKRAEILCHDCDKRSFSSYHFSHLKCGISECGGYNTRLIRVLLPGEAGAVPSSASVPASSDVSQLDSTDANEEGYGSSEDQENISVT